MGSSDDLQRFVDAQDPVYGQVCAELKAGQKSSHWMWFVFPQLQGLGHSSMARRYGVASLAQARAYMAHPVLGPRLTECVGLMLAVPRKSAHQILGSPDDLKFRSCLTLFKLARPDMPEWDAALARFYAGQPDPATLELAQRQGGAE